MTMHSCACIMIQSNKMHWMHDNNGSKLYQIDSCSSLCLIHGFLASFSSHLKHLCKFFFSGVFLDHSNLPMKTDTCQSLRCLSTISVHVFKKFCYLLFQLFGNQIPCMPIYIFSLPRSDHKNCLCVYHANFEHVKSSFRVAILRSWTNILSNLMRK